MRIHMVEKERQKGMAHFWNLVARDFIGYRGNIPCSVKSKKGERSKVNSVVSRLTDKFEVDISTDRK